MKQLIVWGLLGLSSTALADKLCWDGTFGYNHARAVETVKGLELSISGSNLNLPQLFTSNGTGHVFGNFSNARPQLHLVIPKSAVQSQNGALTAAVSGTLDDTLAGKTPALWIEHQVQDLDQWRKVLSPVPLLNLKASIDGDAVTLSFTQLWAYDDNGDHTASTISFGCLYESAPDALRVPAALKKFLNAKK